MNIVTELTPVMYKEEGYVAFVIDPMAAKPKMLRNTWAGASQTGTNKQTLTTDIDRASINDIDTIKMFTTWYNNSHKNPVEFVIKKVERKTSINFKIID